MTLVGLDRLQFGVTTIYHFLFVPLTIGLAFLLAVLESWYWRRPEPGHRKVLDFFGRLFLINFAVGVVTGILQEFQFGMNWANYSRFVGDVFGAPLAVEALAAFFLESTFLGVWIFGWDRLSPRLHAWSMWLTALGTTISAFWILAANSFMQEPVGYRLVHGRAEMVSFGALVTNPQLWVEFPHVELGALATGAFFMMGVSAYFLARGRDVRWFLRPFRLALAVGVVTSVLVVVLGHDQAQHLMAAQPMKMAASEALWHTSALHAPWTVVALIHPHQQRNTAVLAIPDLLSILAYNRLSGRVPGIDTLQHLYVRRYGPGWYVPPVVVTFWSFRLMILAGFLMMALTAYGVLADHQGHLLERRRYLRLMVWAIGLPLFANIMGWVMTEVGRQPWIVFGLEKTQDAISPAVGPGAVWGTLIGFGLGYGVMTAFEAYLMLKYIRLGLGAEEPEAPLHPAPA
ncbi:MAG: cytochrome ubiquinol oxidase subunit I [Firmicutes bacterium]|nr:cytochrome ubiquinol oxidase subunit I [Alicyclobacillaceae bacterium]MCL6498143.1 cytochrome ubiquinol oxidase subunit I [Bacillota bacterium]